MEKIRITKFEFTNDPDYSELFMWLNNEPPQSEYAVPVNDETDEPYYVHMDVNPETHKIVSAFVIHADNLFEDLGRAFASKDLNHPDVRFFLEKKLELYAERHAAEIVKPPGTLQSEPMLVQSE